MTDLYGFLFRSVLYPGFESGLKRRPTLEHLETLERTQWSSLDELHAFQERELKRLLAHAYQNVPYARTKYRSLGIGLEDIRHLDDLQKLPLLTRAEASEHASSRRSVAPPLPSVDKSTSGTTGRPLAFAYDEGSEYWRRATRLRGYAWAGYRLGDPSIHFWGSPNFTTPPLRQRIKASVDQSLRREHYIDCAERSDTALSAVVEQIRKLAPTAVVCYAQAGAALARYVNATKCRDWGDISVICAAERLFPQDRDAIRQAFGPQVFETYGNREVMLIGAECEAHAGLHLSMENLIVELIVEEAGGRARRAEPGEVGQVALTDLHNYGAPFIRYLTGDLATAMAPGCCACGRSLTRLESVEGRSTDTLRDAMGNPVSGLFFNVLFAYLTDKVRAFQVVQRRDNAIDLRLVPVGTLDDSFLDAVKQHAARFLPGVPVRPEIVPELVPDRGGKLRVVVVEN